MVLRIIAACLAFIPAMAFGVAAVNKYYDYYQTWGRGHWGCHASRGPGADRALTVSKPSTGSSLLGGRYVDSPAPASRATAAAEGPRPVQWHHQDGVRVPSAAVFLARVPEVPVSRDRADSRLPGGTVPSGRYHFLARDLPRLQSPARLPAPPGRIPGRAGASPATQRAVSARRTSACRTAGVFGYAGVLSGSSGRRQPAGEALAASEPLWPRWQPRLAIRRRGAPKAPFLYRRGRRRIDRPGRTGAARRRSSCRSA